MMKKDSIFCYITWNYLGEPCALSTKREFRIKLQWREGIASMEGLEHCDKLGAFSTKREFEGIDLVPAK